jgi:predicted amidohydrolase
LRPFAIAGLQLELPRGNNLAMLVEEIRLAKARLPWVNMLVLSELATYGTAPSNAEAFPGPAESACCKAARDNKVWLITGSVFECDGDKIYNTASVIDPQGAVVARYRKIFPWFPYEAGIEPGDHFTVFDVPGVGRIGVSICYDIWFPEHARTLAWMGAEMIVNPSLTNTIDRDVELSLARATAAQNQCFLFNVNGAGTAGFGRSIVCGPGGEVLHQASIGREVFALEFDFDIITRARERGWHGLGQVVKSFRDNKVPFAPYTAGARSQAFDALGPLKMPKAEEGK